MIIKKFLIVFFIIFKSLYAFSQEDTLIIKNHYINSFPQHANILINDTLKGLTPFRYFDSLKTGDVIKIKLKGYMEELYIIQSADELLNKTFILQPLNSGSNINKKLVFENNNINFNKKRKLIPVIVSGLLTVVSAYLSYTFKVKANGYYEDYQRTGDNSFLDKTKKYDLYSGISLVTFQVSLGFFIYYLLID
jgi:hypothetical protein